MAVAQTNVPQRLPFGMFAPSPYHAGSMPPQITWFWPWPGILNRLNRSIAILAVSICLAQGAASEPRTCNVLVLYAHSRLLPANIEADRGLNAAIGGSADTCAEFLDIPKFHGESYYQTIVNYLRGKYAGRPIDVVVAGGTEALLFVLHQREQLFPNAPVVYMGVSRYDLRGLALPADVVGVADEYDFAVTVEQMLRFHPKAKRLVLVTGTSDWDRAWESRLRNEVSRFQNRVQPEFLSGLPSDELLKRLGSLGDDAVLFTPGYFGDGAGQVFTPRASVEKMAAVAAAPIYSPFMTFIGSGIVGGQMAGFEATGRQAGEIVNRLLRGEPPSSLNLRQVIPSQFHVDWRQVMRWGIDEDLLPPGTVAHLREPSIWEMHRTEMAVLLAMLLAQAVLIAGLLVERRSRKRLGEALEESEARLSLSATSANAGLWHWEPATGHLWATDKAREMFGLALEENISFGRLLAIVHPDDRDRLQETMQKALRSKNDTRAEYRILLPDGTVRWIMSRGRALSISHGKQVRVVGLSFDITDQKVTELRAEQDRARLAHLERVAMLSALSASLAHELNQPLTAILANAEAAQRSVTSLLEKPTELVEIFGDIVSDVRRTSEHIRSLRGLFKRGELQIQSVDMNDLINKVAGLVASDLLMRHVSLVKNLASLLPTIEGDRVQLEQVLLNLVVNAAQAMETCAPEQRRLTIRTEAGKAEIRVSVIDSGEGVPAEQLDKIFEPFVSTKPEGLGIGLMICHSIIRAHGGRLTATNNPDRGATFCFALPIQA